MDYTNSPDYLKAADLHNLGNGNESFFDSPIDQTVNFVSKIPAFALTSVASGVNSIYNSGVVAGNWLGISNAEENNLQETLNSYDSDLGKYYSNNKEAIDLTGFIVTSIIPGMGGVKVFNAGQKLLSNSLATGSVGRTFAQSTGLIQTVTAEGKTLAQVAGASLAQSQQTFTVMNAGVVKALASGVVQATLESAAFEIAVAATMFRSPILENQSFKDISSNIITGALFGGAIGGAFNAAGVYGAIKKTVQESDLALKPYVQRGSTFGLTEASDRIALAALDLDHIPEAIDAATAAAAKNKVISIKQDIRKDIHILSVGDEALGNVVADTLHGQSGSGILNAIGGAKLITRPNAILTELAEGHSIGYVKLHGEGAGNVSFDTIKPAALSLADKYGTKQAIDNYVASHKFGEKKFWSPITSSSTDEIESAYVWAETIAKYKEGMKIGEDHIPLLEGAVRNKLTSISIEDAEGRIVNYTSASDIKEFLLKRKVDMAEELIIKKRQGWGINEDSLKTITTDEIAKVLNVSPKFLEQSSEASVFARQDAQVAYNEFRKASGLSGEVDLNYVPQHIAVVYDSSRLGGANSDLVSAVINTKYQQALVRERADKVTAPIFGELESRFTRIPQSQILESNRYGAGAGLISSANGDYNTLASTMEYIGKATADLIQVQKKITSDMLDSVALRLRTNQAAAIEFSALNDMRNATAEKYVLNEDSTGLIALKTKQYRADIAAGKENVEIPKLQAGAKEEVLFKNEDARDAIIADIEANSRRVVHDNNLRAAEGVEGTKNPDVFYGHRPDPKSMPFFAFVKDETITGKAAGHTSMLHAATESDLKAMIQMVNERTGFSVYTKEDTKRFFEAQKSYEFDRTLHDNYIDSSLKSAGVNNTFFPKTDPTSIVDEWLINHSRRDTSLARDAVAVKYGAEFDQLETLGAQYTNIAASKYGGTSRGVESTVQNPYNDYRKTALNISRLSEYPILSSVNRALESSVSGVVQKLSDAWRETKTLNDLPAINKMLEEAGINHAYKNAAEVILANHTAPKPYVSNFIRGANSILANTFLRLDFLNPIANAVGAQVLLGSETSQQVKALLRDTQGIAVPGTKDKILSPLSFIAKANADYVRSTPELDALFKANSLTTSTRDQFKSMLDDISLSGMENPAQLNTKLQNALNKGRELADLGERVTGNKMAEEYNRFVAAHVAKQIADIRIGAGLMPQEGIGAFMNTFVNRTQTNTLSSQRPLIFQGPIGQAVGLFQSFQFNTMQQLFRGVSEGGAKDAAMLLGLQGTIFGLNGLPGFQYINQHIIGTASGNKEHTDAYSTLYGAAGKTAGDWLMYGIPSNMLQTNLYSRGDINPRTLTVIPVNPADIVAVSAFSKFAANLSETYSKIAGGGDVWQSTLQGLEHNTLSRPLAGLAQTLQATSGSGKVFSTTKAGDISFVNDLMSVATLSRLAGGKPLDEALANDEVARSTVYKAADRVRMKAATELFKTSVVGAVDFDGVPPEAVTNYMEKFVKNGGRQEDFNRQMLNALTKVNTPKANSVMNTLKGPYAEHMKSMMGGRVEELQE